MGKLNQKIAIITGAGTGIGRSIALTFAREGADVVIASRNSSNLKKVAREIQTLGRRSLAIITDVQIKSQVEQMINETLRHFGKIDILINNSGIGLTALITEMSEKDWDEVINTNLKGVFLCMQAVAKHMIAHRFGRIINITSIAGIRPTRPTYAAYCASKAGVEILTKCATLELTPYGINVNNIAPGSIETEINRKGKTREQIEEWLSMAQKAPIGKVGNPQDIANAALFLASDEANFICGETLVVDGGRNVRMS